MSFDLQNLLSLGFPDALCPACAAILYMDDLFDTSETRAACPGCLTRFDCTYDNWSEFFSHCPNMNLQMNSLETLSHAHELTTIVADYQNNELNSIELLLQLLSKSRFFVHFSTWNFSSEMIGVLAMAAMRLPVRGLIGKPLDLESDIYKVNALRNFTDSISNLELTLTGSNSFEQTHSKIYIFDGIVALHGSPNLTLCAWLKLSESREHIDVVTAPHKVRHFNNRYIARFLRRQKYNPTSAAASPAG